MRYVHNPDVDKLREKEYKTRDAKALSALWKMAEKLEAQGIDIGREAKHELAKRKKIRERYRNKIG